MTFMADMAQRTWGEILQERSGGHKKHHDQSIDSITNEAQDDLRRLQLDEVFGDSIFRFRLDGKKRFWGFRSGCVFHIVWWDPEHQVYPTEPE